MKCWNGYHKEGTKEGLHGRVNDCKKDKKINKPIHKKSRGA